MAWFTWDLHQNLGMKRNRILAQNLIAAFCCGVARGKLLELQSWVEQHCLQRQSSMPKLSLPSISKNHHMGCGEDMFLSPPQHWRLQWQRTRFQSVCIQNGYTDFSPVASFPNSSYPSSGVATDDRGWGTFPEELCESHVAAGVEAVPSRLELTSDREELWV